MSAYRGEFMQIIIPMSGTGDRFRSAGYAVPKPLIPVDGRPMINHVIEMFPGDHTFIFVCNREHLESADFAMRDILETAKPGCVIVPVEPHKLGPVHAVLQAANFIDPTLPTIISYCDFSLYWDFDAFEAFVVESDCHGCMPAFRGFHPHSLGPNFYAYLSVVDDRVVSVKEKEPFTDHPLSEFASTGIYYFKDGSICLDSLRRQVELGHSTNGEYYVSLSYNSLVNSGVSVFVYEVQHYMCWGTPTDLEDYQYWSNVFRSFLAGRTDNIMHSGAVMVPMAGFGRRFLDAGFRTIKPLIEVSGRPMAIRAVSDLPIAPLSIFVLREDMVDSPRIAEALKSNFYDAKFVYLDGPSDGQAISCLSGCEILNPDEMLTIGACDNGFILDQTKFLHLINEDPVPDVIVWTFRGHATARRYPWQFGWVNLDAEGYVLSTSVKSEPVSQKNASIMTGTFTFRRMEYFLSATRSLIARDGRVNGEFYIDSLIEDCLDMGLRVKAFEVDAYISWGTPEDLWVYEYWQSCFHKWHSHPYTVERDLRIPVGKVEDIIASCSNGSVDHSMGR